MLTCHLLTLEPAGGGPAQAIHPVLVEDGPNLVLVDAGYPGDLERIEQALSAMGRSGDQLTRLVLTHQDYDHMGAAAAFKRKYPRLEVLAGETEAPYLTGERPNVRLVQALELQGSLPASEREAGAAFIERLSALEPVAVDRTLRDGEALSPDSGIEVMYTPGHTPGHISLYLRARRTILTGDAAVLENGELAVANPRFTLDPEQARRSLAKLLACDADTFICYHGGVHHRV